MRTYPATIKCSLLLLKLGTTLSVGILPSTLAESGNIKVTTKSRADLVFVD